MLSKHFLLSLTVLAAASNLARAACSDHSTGAACLSSASSCGWCASSYSCLPADSSLCLNECAFCTTNVTHCSDMFARYPDVIPPPVDWALECANEGVKTWSSDFPFSADYPNQRFGGVNCNCPGGWKGHECNLCHTNSSCSTNDVCNYGWIPTAAVPLRTMSCTCDSELCQGDAGLDAGQAVGALNLQFLGQGDFDVEFRLDKRIPHPGDRAKEVSSNQMQSTVALKAKVASCKSQRQVNCKDACNGCTNPWGNNEYCNILECQTVNIECPPSGVPSGSSEAFDFHSNICTNQGLTAALQAPFTLACIDNGEGNSADPVTCSFSTNIVSHGMLVFTCDTGKCASEDDPIFTPEPVIEIECGALNLEKSACNTLKYSVSIIIPVVTSLLIVGCFSLCNRTKEPRLIPQDDDDDDSREQLVASDEKEFSFLVFKNVCFDIKPKGKNEPVRRVLDNINGYVGGPQLCAILGPSGAGKTSLIDILAGRKNTGKVSGVTAFGGKFAGSRTLRRRVGYVMQDDVLPGTSTVHEYLSFHASLRLHNQENLESRVNEVIRDMGLHACAFTKIGDQHRKGISGGEKRRVSIGCELLADKDLILMDEPTSGLDATSAQQVVSALRVVVKRGKGVVVSIHQPSSRLFSQFDRVMLLSQCGLVYMGPSKEMVDFLANQGFPVPDHFNPAEFALDVVGSKSEDTLKALIKAYRKSEVYREEILTLNRVARINPRKLLVDDDDDDDIQPVEGGTGVTKVSFGRQFSELGIRFTRNVVRHPVLPMVHIVATLLVALASGLLYFDIRDDLGGAINRAGFFFFFLAYLSFVSLSDLGHFQEERLLFIRERAAGCYDSGAYLLAKSVCEIIPLRLAPIALGTVTVVELIGLQNSGKSVATVLGVFLLVSVIFVYLNLVVGMAIRSAGVANFVCVVIALFSLLMSGFLLIDFGFVTGESESGTNANFNSLWPLGWLPFILGFLSPLRPAFEILMVNELSGLTFNVNLVSTSGSSMGTSIPASGDLVLAQLNLSTDAIAVDFVFLTFWLLFFASIAAALLKYRVKENR